MCSVLGCESERRSAQRFKLPEDPERRLEWVQFLFEVNGQRLKESSWTDITICSEHFADDCFAKLLTPTGAARLKPSAAPSLCLKSQAAGAPESPRHVEPVETTDVSYQRDDFTACNSPTSYSEKSKHTVTGSQASPPDVSNAVTSGSEQRQHKGVNIDLHKEKAALLQMKGKYVVNESRLLQLFNCKCPSCGCKLRMEKVTYGVLVILNQQCPRCEYRYQWKSQVNASVPTAGGEHLSGGSEVSPETKQEIPTDGNSQRVFSEIVTFGDEESDCSDEGEEDYEGGASSDGEWNPAEDVLLAEETEDEGDKEEDFDSTGGLKINELCTECGSFFNVVKPHTCEHKIKPFSCNVCGKRCVTEMSLKTHSKIHDETYEHPCKYCHVTFKMRVDKLKHEQMHEDNKDPYKCPDCAETFSTSKERSIHLANHRAPKEFKCGVCGIEFKDVHHLRRHSVVHTGLKPYKCSVCHRGFNQASHLKSHMRLHTGERPFRCQHCDKSFNHNVSLKSHVQRYHSSSPGRQRHEGKKDERASDTGEDGENNRGSGSEFDDQELEKEEEEQDTEEKVQKDRTEVPKSKKRSTGRPRGRPKRNAAGNLVLPGGRKGANAKTAKSKVQKLKKSGSSDEEESEDERSDSDISFHLAEEVEEMMKSTRSSGGKNDSEFDPEEGTKRKRYSSPSRGKSSGRGRGRRKKK